MNLREHLATIQSTIEMETAGMRPLSVAEKEALGRLYGSKPETAFMNESNLATTDPLLAASIEKDGAKRTAAFHCADFGPSFYIYVYHNSKKLREALGWKKEAP